MNKTVILTLLCIVYFLASAYPAEETKQKTLTGIEVLSGFGSSNLHRQSTYKVIPLSLSFDFNLKNLARKITIKQLLQFQLESFLSPVYSPKANLETGATFWLKAGLFPETWKLQPYFKVGLGLLYMTMHTFEQSTQFNFTEQGGLGFHYYLTQNTAFTLEGRYRHVSNAAIKEPNRGINAYFVNTGISYRF